MNNNSHKARLKRRKSRLLAISVALLLLKHPCTELYAQPRRFKSVKSLTHILSRIERENGEAATFVTMQLQIYLEDVYISQGTEVSFDPKLLSKVIREGFEKGDSKRTVSRHLLRMYQNGRLNE